MSGENELKPFHESAEFKKWFEDSKSKIELGDFSDRELLAMAWNAATPPGTELVPEGTMEAFAELLGCLPGRIVTRDIGTCGKCGGTTASGMHKICYKCLREKASAILTRHRATQKDKEK